MFFFSTSVLIWLNPKHPVPLSAWNKLVIPFITFPIFSWMKIIFLKSFILILCTNFYFDMSPLHIAPVQSRGGYCGNEFIIILFVFLKWRNVRTYIIYYLLTVWSSPGRRSLEYPASGPRVSCLQSGRPVCDYWEPAPSSASPTGNVVLSTYKDKGIQMLYNGTRIIGIT